MELDVSPQCEALAHSLFDAIYGPLGFTWDTVEADDRDACREAAVAAYRHLTKTGELG